jgi:Endonuclease IV (EC 3.1.21.-)
MKVGAHQSIAGGVANAVDRQIDDGGNCGQIFTHSPQVWQNPSIDDDDAGAFISTSADHGSLHG